MHVEVYTPDSLIRRPDILSNAMLCDLGSSREQAWRFFVRNISARYLRSFYGVIWAFVRPIVMAVGLLIARNAGTDVTRTLTMVATFWMFLTPLLYPVPEMGLLALVVELNPVTHLLATARELLTGLPVSAPLVL